MQFYVFIIRITDHPKQEDVHFHICFSEGKICVYFNIFPDNKILVGFFSPQNIQNVANRKLLLYFSCHKLIKHMGLQINVM